MKNNIKVLHICSYYLGTKLYQNLFNSLEKHDIEEDIYVFTDNQYKIENEYPSNVYISKCYNKMDRYIFHLKHGKVLKDIKNRLEIKQYDIIHAHSLFSNGYIAFKLKQYYGIPYIVAVRNTDVNLFFNKVIYLRKIGIDILRNAEKIVFISETYKKCTIDKYVPDDYIKEIEDKSIVVPNGIDKFWLKNISKKCTNSKQYNKINIIYVGRVEKNKNIETTVRACKLLIGQGYDISYKVIGKIVDKECKDYISKHSFIDYIPHCQKEELINHYRNSDIFVMPSKHETFGLVYAEAMSQGLPVIYTRGQGFDNQFEEGEVGYSVKYDSAEEIVEKIELIINDYETISNNCIERVNRFDWDKIAEKYINIYFGIAY